MSKLLIFSKFSSFRFVIFCVSIFTFLLSIFSFLLFYFSVRFFTFHFHVSFSRFYFSVRSFLRFNFHVSVVKFQFSRFYFTVRFSAFQFSRFCFVSSCVKKYLFSDCFRLRNFGATCHQRFAALRRRGFSALNFIRCTKLEFSTSLS